MDIAALALLIAAAATVAVMPGPMRAPAQRFTPKERRT